ncbi:DUF1741 domain-containing protein containing protein [Pelomyxa schiedti]|nr:DUF1741 domain-containing protein containing protein [Pelomyxa schiedti]
MSSGVVRSKAGTVLAEKFCLCLDLILRNADVCKEESFWSDFFMLKVNSGYIQSVLSRMSPDVLAANKAHINMLFSKCCDMVNKSDSTRSLRALELLCPLFNTMLHLSFASAQFGYSAIDVICGSHINSFNSLLLSLKKTLDHTYTVVQNPIDDLSAKLKPLCLKLLLTIIQASNNLNQNTLVQYLMLVDMFSSVISTIKTATFGPPCEENFLILCSSVAVAAALTNYRRYESTNPYLVQLQTLSDPLALRAVAHSFTMAFDSVNRLHVLTYSNSSPFYSWIFGSTPASIKITPTLSTSTETLPTTQSTTTTSTPQSAPTSTTPAETVLTVKDEQSLLAFVGSSLLLLRDLLQSNPHFPDTLVSFEAALLGQVVQFLSFLTVTAPSNVTLSYTQICYVVLLGAMKAVPQLFLSESQPLDLFSLNKSKIYVEAIPGATILCKHVLILCRKRLWTVFNVMSIPLYLKLLSLLQIIVSTLREQHSTIDFDWRTLLERLFLLMKFFSSEEIFSQPNSLSVIIKIVNLINYFITYGDSFLRDAEYDCLFYEIVRNSSIINSMSRSVQSHGKNEDLLLGVSFANMRSIAAHFEACLDKLGHESSEAMSYDEIVSLLRLNYSTLKLTFIDAPNPTQLTYHETQFDSVLFTNTLNLILSMGPQQHP